MLILIKGAAGSESSHLAGRIVSHLGLAPIEWSVDPGVLAEARRCLGEWFDLDAYFRDCQHVDLERVFTLLQLDHLHLWPPPPQWSPGSSPEAMFAWRAAIFVQLGSRSFLPALLARTCRLIDSVEQAVVEGKALGGSRQDSLLTRMLRERYQDRPTLRVLLQRPAIGGSGPAGGALALVNGRWLRQDELLAGLSRRPDGGVDVDPELGLSWSGNAETRVEARPATHSMADSVQAGRQR